VVELEQTAPQIVTDMLDKAAPMVIMSADGTQVRSKSSGSIFWDSKTRPKGLTSVHAGVMPAFQSAAACAIALVDVITSYSQPFCQELPTAILDFMSAEPTSELAQHFRLYARHELVPGMQRVAQILETHAAVMDLPPREWMHQKFPGGGFLSSNHPSHYIYNWVGCTEAWVALLEDWDAGEFGAVHLRSGAHFPFAGVCATNDWSVARGEEWQRELVGMTAEVQLAR
jgi:hypothetical protein